MFDLFFKCFINNYITKYTGIYFKLKSYIKKMFVYAKLYKVFGYHMTITFDIYIYIYKENC